jgi:PEP-CTERM motif
VPGFGLPATAATVNGGVPVVMQGTDGPEWSRLGEDSGQCFNVGCGFTGWITSQYTFTASGSYILEFGAVNWGDDLYDSGLAFDGITVAGTPIEELPPGGVPPPVAPIPEPGSYALMLAGLACGGWYVRRRRRARAA